MTEFWNPTAFRPFHRGVLRRARHPRVWRRPGLPHLASRRRAADPGRHRGEPTHHRGDYGRDGGVTEAWRDKVAGILMLWYPGHEGGHAFADLLLGRVNPSGRLPRTFPKSAEDLPFFDKDATAITYDLWHGYRKLERDGAKPAFPFGFGLSYTTFGLYDLRVSDLVHPDGAVVATVDVTNTGEISGEEVVHLYVSARSSAVDRAPRELKAFTKIELEPGETRTIRLAVPATALAYFDTANGWMVEPGDYEVIVGRHSLDEQALHKQVTITQPTP